MFNDSGIISNFFKYAGAQLGEGVALETVWDSYLNSLSEDLRARAKALKSVVISGEEPMPTGYYSALKSSFILALPSFVRLQFIPEDDQHDQVRYFERMELIRDPETGNVSSIKAGDRLNTSDGEFAEEWIAQQKKAQDGDNPLSKFAIYADPNHSFTKRTEGDLGLLYLQLFKEHVLELFSDQEFKERLIASNLSPKKIIELLQMQHAGFLSHYFIDSESAFFIRYSKFLSELDCGYEVQENISLEEALNKFYENAIYNLRIKIAPPITEEDKNRRKKLSNFELEYRNSKTDAQQMLADTFPLLVQPQESAHAHLADSYAITASSPHVNALTQAVEAPVVDEAEEEAAPFSIVSDDNGVDNSLENVFSKNIVYLRQIDAEPNSELYIEAVRSLWDAYAQKKGINEKESVRVRSTITAENRALIKVLAVEGEENKKFLEKCKSIISRSTTSKFSDQDRSFADALNIVAALWAHPAQLFSAEIFGDQDKAKTAKKSFEALYAENPATRLRIAHEWVMGQDEAFIGQIKKYRVDNTESLKENVDPKGRRTALRIFTPIFLKEISSFGEVSRIFNNGLVQLDTMAASNNLRQLLQQVPQRIAECENLETEMVAIIKAILDIVLQDFKGIFSDPTVFQDFVGQFKDILGSDLEKRNKLVAQLVVSQLAVLATEYVFQEESLYRSLYLTVVEKASVFLGANTPESVLKEQDFYQALADDIKSTVDTNHKDKFYSHCGLTGSSLSRIALGSVENIRRLESVPKMLETTLALADKIHEPLLLSSTLGKLWVPLAAFDAQSGNHHFTLEHVNTVLGNYVVDLKVIVEGAIVSTQGTQDFSALCNVLSILLQALNQSKNYADMQVMLDTAINTVGGYGLNAYIEPYAEILHQAIYNNNKVSVNALLTLLPVMTNPAPVSSAYEKALQYALDTRSKKLPDFFDPTRIQKYLEAQLGKFQEFKLSGANEMQEVLSKNLPLHIKLRLIAAIADGVSNRISMTAYTTILNSEVGLFFKGIKEFSSLYRENDVHAAFEKFLRQSGKVDDSIKNVEHHIQRYALLRDELNLIPENDKNRKVFTRIHSIPELSEAPLDVFNNINAIREVTKDYKKDLLGAISSSLGDTKNAFTTSFQRWMQFSITNVQGPSFEDLAFIGVLPTSAEIVTCCDLLAGNKKSLQSITRKVKDETVETTYDRFFNALVNVILTADKETQQGLTKALANKAKEGSAEAQNVLSQVFYQAGKRNDKHLLENIAKGLPIAWKTLPTDSEDSTDLIDPIEFNKNKKFSIFHGEAGIEQYLIDQISKLRRIIPGTGKHFGGISVPMGFDSQVSSAASMQTILKSDLPLTQKLQLLAAIGQAKDEDEDRRSIRLRSPETQSFYWALRKFNGVTEENLFSHFADFFLSTIKTKEELTEKDISIGFEIINKNAKPIDIKLLQNFFSILKEKINKRTDLIKIYVKNVLESVSHEPTRQEEFKIVFLDSLSSLLDKEYDDTLQFIKEQQRQIKEQQQQSKVNVNKKGVHFSKDLTKIAERDDLDFPVPEKPEKISKRFGSDGIYYDISFIGRYLIGQLRLKDSNTSKAMVSILQGPLSLSEKLHLIAQVATAAMKQPDFSAEEKSVKSFYFAISKFSSIGFSKDSFITLSVRRNQVIELFAGLLKSQGKVNQDVTNLDFYVERYILLKQSLALIPESSFKSKEIKMEIEKWRSDDVFKNPETIFDEINELQDFLNENRDSIQAAIYSDLVNDYDDHQVGHDKDALQSAAEEKSLAVTHIPFENIQLQNPGFTELFMEWVRLSIKTGQPLNQQDLYLVPAKPIFQDILDCREKITEMLSSKAQDTQRKSLIENLNQCYLKRISMEKTFKLQLKLALEFFSKSDTSIDMTWMTHRPEQEIPEGEKKIVEYFLDLFADRSSKESFALLSLKKRSAFIAALGRQLTAGQPDGDKKLDTINRLSDAIADLAASNESLFVIRIKKCIEDFHESKKDFSDTFEHTLEKLEEKYPGIDKRLKTLTAIAAKLSGESLSTESDWFVGLRLANSMLEPATFINEYLLDDPRLTDEQTKNEIIECYHLIYPDPAAHVFLYEKLQKAGIKWDQNISSTGLTSELSEVFATLDNIKTKRSLRSLNFFSEAEHSGGIEEILAVGKKKDLSDIAKLAEIKEIVDKRQAMNQGIKRDPRTTKVYEAFAKFFDYEFITQKNNTQDLVTTLKNIAGPSVSTLNIAPRIG